MSIPRVPRLLQYPCILFATIVLTLAVDDGGFKLETLPVNTNYSSDSVEYDDGGLAPLFNFARSFINSALPGGFDEDYVQDLIDNGLSMDKAKELLKKYIGYVIAIGIGILFVIVLPIVATCFCCCRLCGNCGGKRVQQKLDNIHCRRRVYSCVMFVITIFILVGNICTYVTNDRLSSALDGIGDTVENNLNDIDTFLDEISAQINTIGVTQLQKTKTETLKYMKKDDLSELVSSFILNTLSDGALNAMDAHTEELGTLFDKIENASKEVDTSYQTMCSPPVLCSGLGLMNPMTSGQPMAELLDKSKASFDTFRNSNATGKAKTEVQKNVDSSLPDMTSTETSVKNSFDSIENQTKEIQTQIDKFRSDTKSGFDIESMTEKTRSTADTVKTYDKYRHAAGAALGAMITLIAVLQFLGISFGIVGQGSKTAPTDRGCVSNSGGNMLIASVAFIFIFSSLLMLLTTLCFAVGAIVERFFCQPLSDPDLSFLKLAGKYVPGDLVGNSSFADIMLQCKSGKTVYQAFPILQSKFNITEVQVKMDKEKQSMNQKTSDAMKDIASQVTSANFANSATSGLSNLNDSLYKTDFDGIESQATILNNLPTVPPADDFRNAMNNMLDLVKELKRYKKKVGNWSVEFQKGMDDAQAQIQNTTTVNTTIQKFVQQVTHPVEIYVNTTKDNVETKMGNCHPLWSMYNSIVIISVCRYTIDAFNGFWFSIGWCLFFFMPGIVIAVKLAKHYRRMDFPEEDEEYLGMQSVKTNQVSPSG